MLKPVLFHISPELLKELKIYCAENEVYMKTVIAEAVTSFLNDRNTRVIK